MVPPYFGFSADGVTGAVVVGAVVGAVVVGAVVVGVAVGVGAQDARSTDSVTSKLTTSHTLFLVIV